MTPDARRALAEGPPQPGWTDMVVALLILMACIFYGGYEVGRWHQRKELIVPIWHPEWQCTRSERYEYAQSCAARLRAKGYK